MAAGAPPPTSVEVVTAEQVRWQPRVSAVGTLTAREGIDVSNEVEGVIEKIHIESGQHVNKGDLLISLNDDVEQADLVSSPAAQDRMSQVLTDEAGATGDEVTCHDLDPSWLSWPTAVKA